MYSDDIEGVGHNGKYDTERQHSAGSTAPAYP